jgi:hypothetical protein
VRNWSNKHSVAPDDAGRHEVAKAGELLVAEYLGAKRVSEKNVGSLWDLEFQGLLIDVKTKQRNFDSRPDFDAHVEASQINYPVDAYVFCSNNKLSGKTDMVGWIWKKDFDRLCQRVSKGDPDGIFFEQADAYKIKHYLLKPIEGMREAMSEFWIVKDKSHLEQRVKFFADYLDKEWNWEYPVEWRVKRYIPKRSLSQNALFHVWCREMAEHFKSKGADVDEEQMKELIKYKILGTEDRQISNTIIPAQIRETSGLDRGEMMDFMDKVMEWALDHGVRLSCPQDSEYMKLKGG